jgi:hypothetical protein
MAAGPTGFSFHADLAGMIAAITEGEQRLQSEIIFDQTLLSAGAFFNQ